MPDACPKAVCYKCRAIYSGWSLTQRETCDCEGKLHFNSPYNIIIGYLKAGRRNKEQEEEHEIWTRNNPG